MSVDGNKFDSFKIDMTLLPASFLRDTAEVLDYGVMKYMRRFDYRDVEDCGRRYFSALLRHLIDFMDGEDQDKDSGFHHLAMASANIAILLSLKNSGIDIGYWRESSGSSPKIDRSSEECS